MDIYEKIKDKLEELSYPCTLVLYGPSRSHRTTYRAEHSEAFSIDMVKSFEDAWALVEQLVYPGWPGDLEIYAISQTVVKIKER